MKFGLILWVISYGLSFSGFAINLSLVGDTPPPPPKKKKKKKKNGMGIFQNFALNNSYLFT